jgi:hypothetical protein
VLLAPNLTYLLLDRFSQGLSTIRRRNVVLLEEGHEVIQRVFLANDQVCEKEKLGAATDMKALHPKPSHKKNLVAVILKRPVKSFDRFDSQPMKVRYGLFD